MLEVRLTDGCVFDSGFNFGLSLIKLVVSRFMVLRRRLIEALGLRKHFIQTAGHIIDLKQIKRAVQLVLKVLVIYELCIVFGLYAGVPLLYLVRDHQHFALVIDEFF